MLPGLDVAALPLAELTELPPAEPLAAELPPAEPLAAEPLPAEALPPLRPPLVAVRSAYPTPRTVWISRGSPSISVFFRTYITYTSSEFEAGSKSKPHTARRICS